MTEVVPEEVARFITDRGNEVTLTKLPQMGTGLILTVHPTVDMDTTEKFAVYLDVDTLTKMSGFFAGHAFKTAIDDGMAKYMMSGEKKGD